MPERRFNSHKFHDVECDMKRSLNIPMTDKELWDVIYSFLSNSIMIRNKFQQAQILGDGLNVIQIKKYIQRKNSEVQMDLLEKEKN